MWKQSAVHVGQQVCKSLVYTGPGFASLNCEGTHACQSLSATGLPAATVQCSAPRKCHDDWDEATSKHYKWDSSICHSGNGACRYASFGGTSLPVKILQRTFVD